MLLPIAGKPLIVHTAEKARTASEVDRVIVATDDERIREAVENAGFQCVMTSSEHQSGSDRIAEVARGLPEGTIIVNLQGDEPVILPKTIDRAVQAMRDGGADIVTAFESIGSVEELEDPNVVKVVTNADGRALYFSRSPMPFPREATLRNGGPQDAIRNEPEILRHYKKHTGLYVYRREYLLEFSTMPQTGLEKLEMLEQLRALESGAFIMVVEAASKSIGVDTVEDLDRVRQILEAEQVRFDMAEPLPIS